MVTNNYIADNALWGIDFERAKATLRNNQLSNNSGALYFYDGNSGLLTPVEDIDRSNIVDGKPVYYWVNQQNKSAPSDAGYVLLVNCNNIAVKGLSITSNGEKHNSNGIQLLDTSNVVIAGNVLTAGIGISVNGFRKGSANVSVFNNTLTTGLSISGQNSSAIGNSLRTKGIEMGSGVYVTGNSLSSCDVGIRLNGYNTLIFQNNITNVQPAYRFLKEAAIFYITTTSSATPGRFTSNIMTLHNGLQTPTTNPPTTLGIKVIQLEATTGATTRARMQMATA